MSQNDFRPTTFAQLEGQDTVKEYLKIQVESFKRTRRSPGHVLLLGPSGIGKTTLANVFALALGTHFHSVKATEIKNWGDLIDILVQKVKEGDVVFLDEIHALPRSVQEKLYGVMEDFEYLGTNHANQVVTGKLAHFTLVGATTHEGELMPALVGRFDYRPTLVAYTKEQLTRMIRTSSCRIYGVECPEPIALSLANLSQGTARRAYALLRSLHMVASGLERNGAITQNALVAMLRGQDIDPLVGFERASRQYLMALYRERVPVGKSVLSALLGKSEETIAHSIEPGLMNEDLSLTIYENGKAPYAAAGAMVKSTGRGRVITENGLAYLKMCREAQVKGWFAGEKFE